MLDVKVLILAVRLCAGIFNLGDGRKEQRDVCWTLVFSSCELCLLVSFYQTLDIALLILGLL